MLEPTIASLNNQVKRLTHTIENLINVLSSNTPPPAATKPKAVAKATPEPEQPLEDQPKPEETAQQSGLCKTPPSNPVALQKPKSKGRPRKNQPQPLSDMVVVSQGEISVEEVPLIDDEIKPPQQEKQRKILSNITLNDVRAALFSLAHSKGKEASREVLAQFNVVKVTELKEADYNKVIDVAYRKQQEAA